MNQNGTNLGEMVMTRAMPFWLATVSLSTATLAAPGDEGPAMPTVQATVQTTAGMVAGKALPSGVQAWLGVPFAKSPTGDLRWAAPQPAKWDGVFHADRKGPACIQVLRPHDINHYFGEEATGEDCLTMNIWAPPGVAAGAQRPVVVFIYGGGFTIGSSGMANYDGDDERAQAMLDNSGAKAITPQMVRTFAKTARQVD